MERLKNQKFYCAKCDINFEEYSAYIEHEECKPTPGMLCQYCDRFGTYNEMYLKIHHWAEHHHFTNNAVVSELSLDLNSRKFWITENDFELEADLSCDICEFTCETPDEFSAHYIEKHSEAPILKSDKKAQRKYKCGVCLMTTHSSRELEFHTIEKHSGVKRKADVSELVTYLNKQKKLADDAEEKQNVEELREMSAFWKCPDEKCDYENVIKEKMSLHWQQVHKTLPEPLPIKAYLV